MSAASEDKDVPAAPHNEIDLIKEDAVTASDNDAAEPERPVRRKLQETRITSDGNPSVPDDDVENADRGRLKKRSHDDLQAEEGTTEQQTDSGHRRKRSRDTNDDGNWTKIDIERTTTPEPTGNKDDASAHILSPKKKRSLDQLQENGASAQSEEKANQENEKERETKRHRDASKDRLAAAEGAASTKTSLPKSFLNTSAVSPFASLGAKSSESEDAKPQTTSSSAFASSGLASFAGSEQSPFGALGSSTASVFSKATTTSTEKPAGSGFSLTSNTSSASPFATTGTSGFASLGSSGFGSGFGSGGFGGSATKLSSFASATGTGLGGSTTAKPFGADRDSDEEEEEEEGNVIPAGFEKEKEDERFFEQQIETGEEEEKTYFSCKAKLFHFTNKEWKERGVGTFKVNVKEPPEVGDVDDAQKKKKKTARMIMRADGVLRVMLNSPIFRGMPVGEVDGAEPKGKQLNLASVEDGKTVPLLLRVGNADSAKELYHVIIDLQKDL
ncbi:nuclear protein export protein Yrb2, putative [Talaromyces stipitatus ATCC 10500]|uniref:Nuclear protein export protein Yrb2, putative n=1 Tax=Talaromyces stipitatus (strain ATCC 10500 / CBS 375.48 / QM 6759 / NRRL 1006) TaxID=441959 RepID=B8M8P8_TALSN|nr:nuclear protein export protein Yrb2, putative [Talaromyces stipitatus ATCC 10500]XP_002480996.1 nuclear protein export protein Yrb2, putative [Talaromyces stipitatus ATCC 10500]EED20561.1 nuclear protein export protein Yrb2, putative [Talaromyces stipitatus ATCC 10500]EED20562.1 nuclear protein export protein Yrb2, putative [Talaromyces stipitatus ATCC 10500]